MPSGAFISLRPGTKTLTNFNELIRLLFTNTVNVEATMQLVSLYQQKVDRAGRKMLEASRGIARRESSCRGSRTLHPVHSSSQTFPRGSPAERSRGSQERLSGGKNSIGNHPGLAVGVRRSLYTCSCGGRGSGAHSAVPRLGLHQRRARRAVPARTRLSPGTPGPAPARAELRQSGRVRTLPGDVPRLVPEPHLEVLPGLFQPRGDRSR